MESPQTRPSPPGQWAGGRVLTNSQRDRKRAIDRQRVSKRRQQTSERITNLESKLEQVTAELEALKKAKQPTVSVSMADLAARSKCAQRLANDLVGDSWSGHVSTVFGMDVADNMSPSCFGDNLALSASSSGATFSSDSPAIEFQNTVPQIPQSLEDDVPTMYDQSQATECQRIFSRAIYKVRNHTVSEVCIDDVANQNALIRGILLGWDDVESHALFFCPLWRTIRNLDMRLFQLSDVMTRLCALRMIHKLLLCLVKATSFEDLPTWYRPRPAQYKFPHALAADILPWPGLRERAVISSGLTLTNSFWTDIIYLFRFHFPFPYSYCPSSPSAEGMKNVVVLDPNTDHYTFTDVFVHHLLELRMWRVDPAFFEDFPETYDDIVPVMHIERPLLTHVGGTDMLWQCRKTRHHVLPLPKIVDVTAEDDEEHEDVLRWRELPLCHSTMLAPVVRSQ